MVKSKTVDTRIDSRIEWWSLIMIMNECQHGIIKFKTSLRIRRVRVHCTTLEEFAGHVRMSDSLDCSKTTRRPCIPETRTAFFMEESVRRG